MGVIIISFLVVFLLFFYYWRRQKNKYIRPKIYESYTNNTHRNKTNIDHFQKTLSFELHKIKRLYENGNISEIEYKQLAREIIDKYSHNIM